MPAKQNSRRHYHVDSEDEGDIFIAPEDLHNVQGSSAAEMSRLAAAVERRHARGAAVKESEADNDSASSLEEAEEAEEEQLVQYSTPDRDDSLCALKHHADSPVHCVDVGLNPSTTGGVLILSGDEDDTGFVVAVDEATGVGTAVPLHAHADTVTNVLLLSPDLAVTGGMDGLVCVWSHIQERFSVANAAMDTSPAGSGASTTAGSAAAPAEPGDEPMSGPPQMPSEEEDSSLLMLDDLVDEAVEAEIVALTALLSTKSLPTPQHVIFAANTAGSLVAWMVELDGSAVSQTVHLPCQGEAVVGVVVCEVSLVKGASPSLLGVASTSTTVRAWDIASQKPLWSITPIVGKKPAGLGLPPGSTLTVLGHHSATPDTLVLGSASGSVVFLSISKGSVVSIDNTAHTDPVFAFGVAKEITATPTLPTAFTLSLGESGEGGSVVVWNMLRMQSRFKTTLPEGAPVAAGIGTTSGGVPILTVASTDGSLYVFSIASAAKAVALGHTGPIHSLSSTIVTSGTRKNQLLVVTAGEDGEIRLWNPEALLKREEQPAVGGVSKTD